jgi:hypothetical protein
MTPLALRRNALDCCATLEPCPSHAFCVFSSSIQYFFMYTLINVYYAKSSSFFKCRSRYKAFIFVLSHYVFVITFWCRYQMTLLIVCGLSSVLPPASEAKVNSKHWYDCNELKPILPRLIPWKQMSETCIQTDGCKILVIRGTDGQYFCYMYLKHVFLLLLSILYYTRLNYTPMYYWVLAWNILVTIL